MDSSEQEYPSVVVRTASHPSVDLVEPLVLVLGRRKLVHLHAHLELSHSWRQQILFPQPEQRIDQWLS